MAILGDMTLSRTMKKAFTLIELLVVIAIIAILAAILFPVFAQAKAAAKKTATISNTKQISTGMFLYLGDNEDMYPRQSSCVLYSSLNPVFKDASYNSTALAGCSGGKFYNQVNQYTWQKYVYPYIKNLQVFEHPMRAKDTTQWDTAGQIYNGIVINLGFTGVKNVNFTTGATSSFGDLVPFLGGTQSGFPNPGDAAMFFDNVPFQSTPFSPVVDYLASGQSNTDPIATYPFAIREFWRYRLMKQTAAECKSGTGGTEIDNGKALTGGIIVGRADGSAKFMSGGAFLAKTPTRAEFLNGGSIGSDPSCDASKTSQGYGASVAPNTTIDYPMWGLGSR